MEYSDQINNQTSRPKQNMLWTIRMLLFGGGIILITLLIGTFWENLGFTREQTIWLAISFMLAFGLNIAGTILGFIELKKNTRKAILGLVGNVLFIVFFIMLVMYSLAVAP